MSKAKLTRKQIEEIVRQKVLQALKEEETIEVAGEEIDAGPVTTDAKNAASDAENVDQIAQKIEPINEQVAAPATTAAAMANVQNARVAKAQEMRDAQKAKDAQALQDAIDQPGSAGGDASGIDVKSMDAATRQGVEDRSGQAFDGLDDALNENLTDKEWYDKSLYERLTRKWSK